MKRDICGVDHKTMVASDHAGSSTIWIWIEVSHKLVLVLHHREGTWQTRSV